jgi:hypothetical protein
MKKLVAVLVIALVVAAAVWVAMRIQMAKRLAVVPGTLTAGDSFTGRVAGFSADADALARERSL